MRVERFSAEQTSAARRTRSKNQSRRPKVLPQPQTGLIQSVNSNVHAMQISDLVENVRSRAAVRLTNVYEGKLLSIPCTLSTGFVLVTHFPQKSLNPTCAIPTIAMALAGGPGEQPVPSIPAAVGCCTAGVLALRLT